MLTLAVAVLLVMTFVECRIDAAYDICREVTSGTTAGRQALVGSVWYAPLALILQLQFCRFLPPELSCACYRFVALLAFAWACCGFGLRKTPDAVAARAAWFGRAFDRAARILIAIGSFAFAACARNTIELTSDMFAAYAALKLFDWCSSHELADWVRFSLAIAATVLCGLPFAGWAIMTLAILPVVIACDKTARPRLTGLMFLVCTPVAYVAGCWLLASHLVLGDAFYAWRFVDGIEVAPDMRLLKTIAVCGAAAALFACVRKGNCAIAAIVTALALLWFGTLDSCGLSWAKPYAHGRETLQPPDRCAVMNYVDDVTPWGRVFICGYNGIYRGFIDKLRFPGMEPCIDLHVDALRKAYRRQHLFVLVPKPQCENALESCHWRYDDLYANGTQRLLFAEDFGCWRLYEVISSEK